MIDEIFNVMKCFSGSYINQCGELIISDRGNVYFTATNCKSKEEVKNRLCFGVTYAKDIQIVCEALHNGTPLPKGHGRIGDLDALREEVSSWGMNDYEPSDFIDAIDQADTIIEAYKEQEDDK